MLDHRPTHDVAHAFAHCRFVAVDFARVVHCGVVGFESGGGKLHSVAVLGETATGARRTQTAPTWVSSSLLRKLCIMQSRFCPQQCLAVTGLASMSQVRGASLEFA